MRSDGRGWILAGLMLGVLLGGGCAGSKHPVYLDDQANFSLVKRVAVLPFENFSGDPHAAEKVQQILTIELLAARAFDVVDPAETLTALAAAEVKSVGDMTPDQVRKVGEQLDAQALMMGTVRELSVDRSSGVAAPMVSLQFRLVDAGTGKTLWSTVVTREGVGTGARLFGIGRISTNRTVQKLVRRALRGLIR